MSALSFARMVAQIICVRSESDPSTGSRNYLVQGRVFFASAESFLAAFDFKEALARVRIDMSQAPFGDLTAVGALDGAIPKCRREGTAVEVIGLNQGSATIVDRLGTHSKPGALERLLGH